MIPRWDTGTGALFWVFFGPLILPFVVLVYAPIGVAWIVGCVIYQSARWTRARLGGSRCDR